MPAQAVPPNSTEEALSHVRKGGRWEETSTGRKFWTLGGSFFDRLTKESEACAIVTELKNRACRMLPGYDQAAIDL
jgi:hypothetical protein